MSRREQEKPSTSYRWVLTSLDQLLPGGEVTLLDLVVDRASEASKESEAFAELVVVLDQLPAKQAAVLRLRHLNGLGCRQASLQLGISRSSVSRVEHLPLAQLRQGLGA